MTAAITPQAWIAMCAGVQKVSRPMERCQDTSHAPPMEAEVTASAPHHRYQGTRAVVDTTWVETRAACGVESGILDMVPHSSSAILNQPRILRLANPRVRKSLGE